MKKTYIILILIAAYALILGAPFLLKPKHTVEKYDRNIIILSPHTEAIKYEYSRGFTKWMWENYKQRVGIEWLDTGGTSSQVKYMLSQFAKNPNGIGIDIFYGGGTEPYLILSKNGYLYPYKVPEKILKRIPKDYAGMRLYDSNKGWYGAAISGFGIVYNKVVSKIMNIPVPITWDDLGKPDLYGWVSSGDPANSGSTHMMYEIITQSRSWSDAWRLITQMGGNTRYFNEHSSNVPHDVAVGEVAAGICIDFYAGAEIAEAGKNKVGFVLPKNETVINPDSIGILKGAPNKDLAELFLQYVLSPEGQRILMLPAGDPDGPKKFNLARIPLIPELYEKYADRTMLTFNPYLEPQSLLFNYVKSSDRWSVMNDLWRAMIIDNHKLVSKAWGNLIKLGLPKDLTDEFSKPLISEREVMNASKYWRKNDLKRTNMKNKWSQALKDRYKNIISKTDRMLNNKGK